MSGSYSALLAILVGLAVATCPSIVWAQGSAGGSIGKQGKSASGGEDAAPPRAKSTAPRRTDGDAGQSASATTGKKCPNITGIWTSWASGLFGSSDTNFKPDGTAWHKSGIEGTWRCEAGQVVIHWAGGEKHLVTFSTDGKKVYKTDGTLVFSRN